MPREPDGYTVGTSTSTLGGSQASVKAIPALLRPSKACHALVATAWRELGLISSRNSPGLRIVDQPGTATIRAATRGGASRPLRNASN